MVGGHDRLLNYTLEYPRCGDRRENNMTRVHGHTQLPKTDVWPNVVKRLSFLEGSSG